MARNVFFPPTWRLGSETVQVSSGVNGDGQRIFELHPLNH